MNSTLANLNRASNGYAFSETKGRERPTEKPKENSTPDKETLKNQIHRLSSVIENMRDDQSQHKTTKSLWERFQHEFTNGGPPGFQLFRDNFTLALNTVGILFNLTAVFSTNQKIFPKEVAKFIDAKSEWFIRYIIPLSFGWNALEAFVGGRLIEAASRSIPAALFPILPFYNFNLATGISSGLNYMLELIQNRHKGQHPGKNMLENSKAVIKTSIELFKDIFSFKADKESIQQQFSLLSLLIGSIGGFAFARNERDSFLARFFGNFRNIGGMVADWDLIFNNDPDLSRRRDKTIVGGSCIAASILNTIMRWVSPELARSLNHIANASDDWGLTYWAQSSKRINDAMKQKATAYAFA